MSRLDAAGISLDVSPGWDGAISGGQFQLQQSGVKSPNLLHVGSFPLPVERGTFGSGAVELMNTGDVFMALYEYETEAAESALFAGRSRPYPLNTADFTRENLQRTIPGQSGMQWFFTENGRAFCLYIVLGSHLDRTVLVAKANAVLATLEIS